MSIRSTTRDAVGIDGTGPKQGRPLTQHADARYRVGDRGRRIAETHDPGGAPAPPDVPTCRVPAAFVTRAVSSAISRSRPTPGAIAHLDLPVASQSRLGLRE